MKKALSAVIMFVFLFNSFSYNAEASNKKIFCETEAERAMSVILSEDPNLLLQQYSNILSVETTELSNTYCSNGEIVKAYEQDQDGTVCMLETEATLTKILYHEEPGLSLEGDERPTTLYVLTAETYSSDTTTQYGVRLTGAIAWKDYAGVNNELVAVSGSRSGSYMGDGTYYRSAGTTQLEPGWITFSGASFFDHSVAGTKGYGFQLVIHSPSQSSSNVAQLIIKTSIFD